MKNQLLVRCLWNGVTHCVKIEPCYLKYKDKSYSKIVSKYSHFSQITNITPFTELHYYSHFVGLFH